MQSLALSTKQLHQRLSPADREVAMNAALTPGTQGTPARGPVETKLAAARRAVNPLGRVRQPRPRADAGPVIGAVGPQTLRITREGLQVIDPTAAITVPWSAPVVIRETELHFLLEFADAGIVVVPKVPHASAARSFVDQVRERAQY